MKHLWVGVSVFLISLLLVAPGLSAAELEKALEAFRAEDYPAATAELQALLEDEADNLGARYWLARSLVEQGELEAAERQLRLVLEAKANSTESRYWLGVTLAGQGRTQDARRAFERVLADDPDHQDARSALEQLGASPANPGARVPSERVVIRPADLRAGRIAITAEGLGLNIEQVDILSRNVYDYTFSTATTDWIARGGEWKQTRRWDCSEQWSWYGGIGVDAVAATWNKHHLLGDTTVEIYSAFKMGVGGEQRYRHPNDINICIHGDGANLDSGYNFIVGGGNNTFSRIMKGNEVLAETQELTALFPIFEDAYPRDADEFHHKWWGLRARLTGDRLQLYKDEQLILEAEDADPLPGGRVAIWTMHNGMVVGRVKIYYQDEKIPPDPLPGYEFVKTPPTTTVEPRALVVSSDTHPAIYDDFEVGADNWRTWGGTGGARVGIVYPGADGKGHALALRNEHSGGTFGAELQTQRLDARKYGQLAFRYRVDPDVKVNLQCVVNGGIYEVVFTAPGALGPRAQLLAEFPDIRADGKWHETSLDLVGHLERIYGPAEPIWIEDVYFANTHSDSYIHAGFGGNHAQSMLALDDFYLGGAGGDHLVLQWRKHSGADLAGCSYAVDKEPYTVPSDDALRTETELEDVVDQSGVYYAHLRPKLADGNWGATVHQRVVVDVDPPRVADRSPEPGGASGSPLISARLVDPGGSGIDSSSVKLRVQDKEFELDGAVLRYDPEDQRLSFDPARAGMAFADGETVAVEVAAASDRLGHVMTDSAKWEWRYSHDRDETPPTTPRVHSSDDYLVRDDFETDTGQWNTFGGPDGALVCREPTTAASGLFSLRLCNDRQGGRFGAYIRKDPFDAGKYRLMAFDYKISGRLRSDFALYANGRWRSVHFTDTDNTHPSIGEVPDVRTDGKWHHAEVNLYEMLKQADPIASSYLVRYLILGDWGWMGNAAGKTYYIDNFELIPVVNGSDGVEFSWESFDTSGLAGASYTLDGSPDTDPGTRLTTDQASAKLQPEIDGVCYLHVRTQDKAGNWSEPGHLRVIVDKDRPTVSPASPQPNQRVAASRIVFDLTDKGPAGINPASISMKVGGQEYDMSSAYLTYDSEAQQLVWDGGGHPSRPIAFENGQTIDVELLGAADFAGNQAQLPPAFSWTMDFASDTDAPEVTQIRSTSHLTFVNDTFEDGMGMWRTLEGEPGATLSIDEAEPASGQRSLKITNDQPNGTMGVIACDEAFSADRYPYVSFDYKLDPGTKLNLLVLMEGTWHAVRLTDVTTGMIGTVSGAAADGQWHHATVHLSALLRSVKSNGALEVQQVAFADRGNLENRVGTTAHIDNFMIARVGKSSPTFRWSASDPTGITDYSYVLDQAPTTVPDETSEGPATSKIFRDTQGGLWYFHIRARDGAGHWGPAEHYAILHIAPPANG